MLRFVGRSESKKAVITTNGSFVIDPQRSAHRDSVQAALPLWQLAETMFLLARAAERRGDIVQAARFLCETIALTGEADPELRVTAQEHLTHLRDWIFVELV